MVKNGGLAQLSLVTSPLSVCVKCPSCSRFLVGCSLGKIEVAARVQTHVLLVYTSGLLLRRRAVRSEMPNSVFRGSMVSLFFLNTVRPPASKQADPIGVHSPFARRSADVETVTLEPSAYAMPKTSLLTHVTSGSELVPTPPPCRQTGPSEMSG